MSLSKGLVLHHPLEQEYYNSNTKRFTDKSAYGNHGTSFNAAINFGADRMGQSNRSTAFNGSSDYIICGNSTLFDLPIYSVSFWIKSNVDAGTSVVIQPIRNGAIQFNFAWSHSTLAFSQALAHKSGATWYKARIGTSLLKDTWYNITGTYDGTDLKIYLNSVLEDSVLASAPSTDEGSLVFGGGTVGLTGNLSDIRIYNRALSTTEIDLLFNSYRI